MPRAYAAYYLVHTEYSTEYKVEIETTANKKVQMSKYLTDLKSKTSYADITWGENTCAGERLSRNHT